MTEEIQKCVDRAEVIARQAAKATEVQCVHLQAAMRDLEALVASVIAEQPPADRERLNEAVLKAVNALIARLNFHAGVSAFVPTEMEAIRSRAAEHWGL
jgi:hypothetical protein